MLLDNQTANGGTSANTLAGIAITANATTATQGTWQWLTGGVWTDISSAVSDSNALLLAAGTSLRFLPTANWNGTTPGLLPVSRTPCLGVMLEPEVIYGTQALCTRVQT